MCNEVVGRSGAQKGYRQKVYGTNLWRHSLWDPSRWHVTHRFGAISVQSKKSTTPISVNHVTKKLGQHSFVLMCLNGFEIVCLFFLHAFWWFQLDKPSGLYKMQKLFLLVHIPVPTYWGQTLSICEDPPRGLWFCRAPPPFFNCASTKSLPPTRPP